MDILKTIGVCLRWYAVSWVLVWFLWPHLAPAVAWLPAWAAKTYAYVSFLAVFAFITHLQRGKANPRTFLFQLTYLLLMVLYLFSTLHPAQYHAGTAVMEMSFFLICLERLFELKRAGQATLRVGIDWSLRAWRITGFWWLGGLAAGSLLAFLVARFLSPLAAEWPKAMAEKLALVAGFVAFCVTSHAIRGKIDQRRLSYIFAYLGIQLLIGMSTLPPSQFNAGTAALSYSLFSMMLLTWWDVLNQRRTLRLAASA